MLPVGCVNMANITDDAEQIIINVRLPDWLYRKKITIDYTKITTDLIDFPILLSFYDNDLQTKAQSNGNDILFTSADGTTQLDHEIEQYENGSLIAWVKIPNLPSSIDTDIYMYYGNPTSPDQSNPTGVWDYNFLGVYHMNGVDINTILDSTANSNNAISQEGNPTYQQLGKVGKAVDFHGATSLDSIILPKIFNTPLTGFTISIWVKPRIGSRHFINEYSYLEGDKQGVFMQIAADNKFTCRIGWTNTGGFLVDYDTWAFITLTYNGTDYNLFVNGNLVGWGMIPTTAWVTPAVMHLSNQSTGEREFNGMINQVFFSQIARQPGWAITEYNFQNDPQGCITIGLEE